jgi:FlaA1/EpsC-like NDP-sugar epimerase
MSSFGVFAERWARSRLLRAATILSADALFAAAALTGAMALRFDGVVPEAFRNSLRVGVPLLVAVRLTVVVLAQLHRWSFRMSGLLEASRLFLATLAGSALFVLALRYGFGEWLPRSVIALEFFTSGLLMAVLRFAPRYARAVYRDHVRHGDGAIRTIIVGAGNAGDLLSRDLLCSAHHRYALVGFVDDDESKHRSSVNGKPILGNTYDLPRLIARHQVTMVMLAITRLSSHRIREILDVCASSKASFKIVPASFAVLDERLSAAMLHDLSPEDLLSRECVDFDYSEIADLVAGRRALVTGAGGSIGSEICRQLARHGVASLVLVDMNENEMYLLARQLQEQHPHVRVRAEVADVREAARLRRLGERHRPELVFHAAAHKHVPLMEDAPEEAVKNNVFGTLNVARMADACGAERFVLISTDKAVNPTSVMGATKRVAELVVRELARGSRTRMTAVRFGNVLGSAGSVLPIFKQQIERGGPVTVTHPQCTRYFMTIPEAVGLVLLSGLGDYGELCVLDMGDPIRIADMARHLITMVGLVPEVDIPIVYSGLRPGEKMYEELLTEEEEQTRLVRNRIMAATSPEPPPHFLEQLKELRRICEDGEPEGVVRALRRLVPTFRAAPDEPIPFPKVLEEPTPPPVATVLPFGKVKTVLEA